MKRFGALIGLALLAASCSDPVAPAAPTPVEATITEQFSATLPVRGSNVHAFNVSQIGRLRVTQIRPKDVVFTIQDFGYERQETLSLRKQEDVTQ